MPRWRISPATGLLWVAAVCPFLASLVFHAIGPRAQTMAQGPNRPALVFDQYLVNLGSVNPSPEVEAWFYFRNRGKRPVIIEHLDPSCGCLQPMLTKIPGPARKAARLKPLTESTTFEPEERGKILLRVRTAGELPGRREYWVKVRYEDEVPREVMLTFKVELPQHTVVIRPRGLRIYQLSPEPTEYEVEISDMRTIPLSVVGVDSSSKLASVELSEKKADDNPATRARLTVTVKGHIPAGLHEALISARTDDPLFPNLTIPVEIYGPGTPATEYNPAHSRPHTDHASLHSTAARPEQTPAD